MRERAFFAAASRKLGTGAEGVSLENYEGNVNAAAEAMGIDLDAEVAAIKARPAQLDI